MKDNVMYRYKCLDCKREIDVIFRDLFSYGTVLSYCNYCGKYSLKCIGKTEILVKTKLLKIK